VVVSQVYGGATNMHDFIALSLAARRSGPGSDPATSEP
jgi:hypothetical protein